MRFILLILAVFFLPFSVFAQEGAGQTSTQTGATSPVPVVVLPKCSDFLELTGQESVKMNSTHDFLLTNSGSAASADGNVVITSDGREEKYDAQGNILHLTFNTPGKATISFTPNSPDTYHCSGGITKDIQVFREMITYIGENRSDLADGGLTNVFRQK